MSCNLPMQYDFPHKNRHENGDAQQMTGMCFGVAILVILYMLMKTQREVAILKYYQASSLSSGISGMISRFTSARLTNSPDQVDELMDEMSNSTFQSAKKNGANLVNLTPAGKTEVEYNKVSEEKKKKAQSKISNYMRKHPDAAVMFWAPWCPHCHKTLPEFCSASLEVKGKPFAVINAELVPRDYLTSGSDVPGITHFPFIVCEKRVFSSSQNKNEIVKFVSNQKAATADKLTSDDTLDSFFY